MRLAALAYAGGMSNRLPRFTRSSDIPPIEITDRDRRLLQLVHEHRFLNSNHIFALLGGSAQNISRRLQLLYHTGYLERPRCQLDYYYKNGSRPMVYGLADKGAAVLRQHGIALKPDRLSEKNRAVGRLYLEHALFVAEVKIAIEISCRNAGLRFLTEDEIRSGAALRWRVKINDQMELGLMPDGVLGIEYETAQRGIDGAYFFLEADMGTMPIVREKLGQSSMYRKLLSYQATWRQNLHTTVLGLHRFRVLIVTTGAKRMQGMIDCCTLLENGHGLFLFTDRSILAQPQDILSAKWQTGKGQVTTLLN